LGLHPGNHGISASHVRREIGSRDFVVASKFANSSSVPIVVFVDMQQISGEARTASISEIDRALDNCRKVWIIRAGRSASASCGWSMSRPFSTGTPFVPLDRSFDRIARNGFERSSPSCYSCEPFNALVNQSPAASCCRFAGEAACLRLNRCIPPQSQRYILCDASASPRPR